MKRIITILLSCLTIITVFSQTNSIISGNSIPAFYLHYGFSGLGSNMGSFQPTIKIKGTDFIYTYEQNSYWGEKSKRVDTICIKIFKQSSIDSIIEIIKDLKDTTIKEYNPCVMSGGIHFLSVSDGIDTTSFELMNTFDYTALKISNILNQYTPVDKKLWANEKMIEEAGDCWKDSLKRWSKKDKRKKKAISCSPG